MNKIIKMSDHLANLIAAGEVIERPSSVVKELVENSIDAKATVINISLIDAGIKEIIVSDNGHGMTHADAKLSIQSHATSKISGEEDLFKIASLGFRGEALPSIVAVSDFKLKTSTDGRRGFMFSARGGKVTSEATIAHPQGTEITVRNLFFNTPARLQSLHSESAELSHIVEYINKMALGNPDLIFKIDNNNRTVFQSSGSGNELEVINNIYGVDVAKNMYRIFNSDGFFEISGLISNLAASRANKNHITIIVNGRVIRNNGIINACLRAYKNLLPIARYPICLINIKVDYSLVDVNVHPAKLELRFSEEEVLFKLITNTIIDELDSRDLSVDMDKSSSTAEDLYDDWDYPDAQDEPQFATPEIKDFDFTTDYESDIKKSEEPLKESSPTFQAQQYRFVGDDEITSAQDGDTKITPETKLPRMDYIGQLFGTYILAQGAEHFFMIDQHAAMERVMYEKILNELKKDLGLRYELLIPIKLDYTTNETILINERYQEIKKLGLRLDYFGTNTFTVREVPAWFIKDHEKEFSEEVIEHIISRRKQEKHEFLDSLAKSLACKKSIKANQYVSSLEINYLLEDLAKCERPFTCPHGRPVIIKYSKYEIEKWFKRVM